jgi:hypothetical protein
MVCVMKVAALAGPGAELRTFPVALDASGAWIEPLVFDGVELQKVYDDQQGDWFGAFAMAPWTDAVSCRQVKAKGDLGEPA